MCKYEKLFVEIVLGAVFPMVGFFVGWWSTSQLLSNTGVFLAALFGMGLGLFINFLFLKKWVAGAFEMDLRYWMAIFIFYSIWIFGFFMGVPVVNVVLAIPAGLILGRIMAYQSIAGERAKQLALKANLFATGMMAFNCASSAFLALRDPSTAANLEGMLRLPFEVTHGMIIALILIGGLGLLSLHWWMLKKILQFARGRSG